MTQLEKATQLFNERRLLLDFKDFKSMCKKFKIVVTDLSDSSFKKLYNKAKKKFIDNTNMVNPFSATPFGKEEGKEEELGGSPKGVANFSKSSGKGWNGFDEDDEADPMDISKDDVINTLRRDLKKEKHNFRRAKETLIRRHMFETELFEELGQISRQKYSFQYPLVKMKGENHMVLPISDVHYGEVVDYSRNNKVNTYNTTIAKQRMEKLFAEATDYAREKKVGTIHIVFLGDIFSGNIHEELMETNEMSIAQCVMDFYVFIIPFIRRFGEIFKVTINGVVGNHPRMTQKFQYKNKAIDNYEYFLYQGLAFEFKNDKNISVSITQAPIDYVKVGKATFRIEHGDFFKGGSAPSGAINSILKNATLDLDVSETMAQQTYDFILMGHWHQPSINYMKGTNIPVIINPSIIGGNEFAINSLHTAFPSSSYLIVTDGDTNMETKLVYL